MQQLQILLRELSHIQNAVVVVVQNAVGPSVRVFCALSFTNYSETYFSLNSVDAAQLKLHVEVVHKRLPQLLRILLVLVLGETDFFSQTARQINQPFNEVLVDDVFIAAMKLAVSFFD